VSAVRVGFIGCGNVVWAYFQAMERLESRGLAEIECVCARREERRAELLGRRPGLKLVNSAREVMDSEANVVVILTPPSSHAELVRSALENGKHVLVEKPLAETMQEAKELAATAKKRDLQLLAAPFVQLAPTFRAMWSRLKDGEIGRIHSARAHYGNAGSSWAEWYHDGSIGPLAEIGIYNLKSLTSVLGPVAEVQAAEMTAVERRTVKGREKKTEGADVCHAILRHESGALSSVMASHAVQRYRRPALEFYGTEGTANLLGDDWDPKGYEIWRNSSSRWEEYEPVDATWLWTDGLPEMVNALREKRAPMHEIEQDIHLIEVIEACASSAKEKRAVAVQSRFAGMDLRLKDGGNQHRVHDHTRPVDEQ
jgi:predicted dehydrogenase